jgi:SPOR domain/Transglycosylase SLT domain
MVGCEMAIIHNCRQLLETRMHGLVPSGLSSVMLLVATLMLALPSQLIRQASAGEPDQVPPVERTIEAIAHSAKLLRDLRRELGNLGLAAAAYNAGPRRVRDWLAGRRGLPRETDAYVRIVTGQSPEQWARVKAGPAEMHFAHPVPCQQIAGLVARAPALEMKPLDPWGVQLVGSSSDATALAAYRRLQEKYAPILGGREPRVLHHGLARGSMGWARVHVGADSRANAEKLCAELRAAGASCTVQRN